MITKKTYPLTNDMVPGSATHPGELIKDEIKARKLNQKEVAKSLGVQPSFLSELIHGKRNVNPELAIKLEMVLGISAKTWMNLQVNYELDIVRIKYRDFLKKDNFLPKKQISEKKVVVA